MKLVIDERDLTCTISQEVERMFLTIGGHRLTVAERNQYAEAITRHVRACCDEYTAQPPGPDSLLIGNGAHVLGDSARKLWESVSLYDKQAVAVFESLTSDGPWVDGETEMRLARALVAQSGEASRVMATLCTLVAQLAALVQDGAKLL